jgi:sugar phosphate isomerase/epimerase
MTRRSLLQRGSLAAALPLAHGKSSSFPRSRVAILTDEAALSPEDAIAFAQGYELRYLELRNVPGKPTHYFQLPPEELREIKKGFDAAGLKVSFLNTPFFKIVLPGTDPVRPNEAPEVRERRLKSSQAAFDRRVADFERGFEAAHILGVDMIRVFGFTRVENPQSVMQQIADHIGEMAELAGKNGIRLAIENEASCNAGTTAELVQLTRLLPAKTVGMNWDPGNAVFLNEAGWPGGYRLLPIERLWNVQVKGRGFLEGREFVDWGAILPELHKYGYRGHVGLEPHYGPRGPERIQNSHTAMKSLLALCAS